MISFDVVSIINDVATADVAPYPGSYIIVYRISSKLHALAQRELHAAGLPFEVVSPGVVRPDAVVLNHDILADPRDADLAVVMNVARTDPRAIADSDAASCVQPDFAV